MELNNIKLDEKELQKKAQEFAHEAAVKELEEYYLSYNSPYRKAIKDELESKSTNWKLNLPSIVGLLNETLSQEVTKIYNTDIGFDILEYKTVKDSKGYNGFDNLDQTFKYIYYEYKSDDFVTIVLKSSNYGIGVTYLRTNIIAVSEDVVSSRIPSHELGHMLGLNHSEGIMDQSRNEGYFSLRQVKAIEDQAQVLINKINN